MKITVGGVAVTGFTALTAGVLVAGGLYLSAPLENYTPQSDAAVAEDYRVQRAADAAPAYEAFVAQSERDELMSNLDRVQAEQAAAAAAAAEAARVAAEQAAAQAAAEESARQANAQQQTRTPSTSTGGSPQAPTAGAPAPIRCPAGSSANSGDGPNDTSCLPTICFSIALPDAAHPECESPFRP